jgi:hypothetical protein
MHRITKRDIEAVFSRLAGRCGKHIAGKFDRSLGPDGGNGGKWSLDYAACYGGWQVIEYIPGGTAETHPLGDRRMNTSEFYHAMHFAMRAMEQASGNVA